jgi:molybdopterin-containing oxidoreductase family iron-sulfur binding subunit
MNRTDVKQYWRSLHELQHTADFEAFLQREFPAAEFPEGISRRRWLQLMGASVTLAGVAGCRWETEKIAPFRSRPESRIPGEPQFYATSVELAGAPRHLLVTCYDGRPIKVEGNPEHPESRGATDAFSQATILELYDPDRSDRVRERVSGQAFNQDWAQFDEFARGLASRLKAAEGCGLALLLQPTASPAIHDVLERLVQTYPKAKLYEYAPVSRAQELAASELAFGQRLRTHWRLEQAEIIVCLDADVLGTHPAAVQYARDFAAGRNPDAAKMNRLYAVESQFSLTGAAADHRLPLRSAQIGGFLVALVDEVRRLLKPGDASASAAASLGAKADPFLRVLAKDLVEHRGKCLVAVGPRQPAAAQALGHQLNSLLENAGHTVRFTAEPEPAVPRGNLRALVARLTTGEVNTLVVVGGNPAYDAPADLQFPDALKRAETTIHLSVYENETSRLCRWHLPQTHPLETWDACRAYDGTLGVAQPLVEPLLDGRSSLEVLARWCGDAQADAVNLVRVAIAKRHGAPLADQAWRKLLHDGFLAGSALPDVSPKLRAEQDIAAGIKAAPADDTQFELIFCPSSQTYDGRFANNGWLQETPDFLTKLVWDNVAIVSPATAEKLGVQQGSVVRLETHGRSLELPVFVLPGQARGSIGIALGYGRTAAGHVGGDSEAGVAPSAPTRTRYGRGRNWSSPPICRWFPSAGRTCWRPPRITTPSTRLAWRASAIGSANWCARRVTPISASRSSRWSKTIISRCRTCGRNCPRRATPGACRST